MRRTAIAVALLAVSVLLLTTGCYTVLRHPTGSEIVQEGQYYRSCADCHADAAYYHPYGHRYYNYGRSHYGWSGYYGYPWWYNDNWWWDDHGHHHDYDDYDGPEVETGTRHLWSSDGWASGGWGFVKPGSSPRSPSSPQRKPDTDDKKEEKKEEKKESEDDRNLWTKPKKKKGF
jgi:uncharacterized protein YceK